MVVFVRRRCILLCICVAGFCLVQVSSTAGSDADDDHGGDVTEASLFDDSLRLLGKNVLPLPPLRQNLSRAVIGKGNKVFYLHVRKAGGTTFVKALRQCLGKDAQGEKAYERALDFHFSPGVCIKEGKRLRYHDCLLTCDAWTTEDSIASVDSLYSNGLSRDIELLPITVVRHPVMRANSEFWYSKDRGRMDCAASTEDFYKKCVADSIPLLYSHESCSGCTYWGHNMIDLEASAISGDWKYHLGKKEASWTPIFDATVANSTTVQKAVKILYDSLDMVGITEHMDLTMCLFYYKYHFDKKFEEECTHEALHGVAVVNTGSHHYKHTYLDSLKQFQSDMPLSTLYNQLDLEVYRHSLRIFHNDIQLLSKATGRDFEQYLHRSAQHHE